MLGFLGGLGKSIMGSTIGNSIFNTVKDLGSSVIGNVLSGFGERLNTAVNTPA